MGSNAAQSMPLIEQNDSTITARNKFREWLVNTDVGYINFCLNNTVDEFINLNGYLFTSYSRHEMEVIKSQLEDDFWRYLDITTKNKQEH